VRIQRAIESVLNQSVPPREVIVVNDGSTDGVEALVQSRYPAVSLLSQPNRGVSAARNLGIRTSQAEWIAFLDSDDEWLSTKLAMQSQWLQMHPDIRICHCDEIWMRNLQRVNPKRRHRKQGGWIYLNCLPLCVISPSAVLIHRSVFDTVGTFDESLPACEDYDLWLRVTHRFKVGYVDQPLLIKYGGHQDQLSKAFVAMDRFRITALTKCLEQASLSPEQRIKTLEMLISKVKVYLNGAKKRQKVGEVNRYQAMLKHYQAQWDSVK